jgi:hypothetical protein
MELIKLKIKIMICYRPLPPPTFDVVCLGESGKRVEAVLHRGGGHCTIPSLLILA